MHFKEREEGMEGGFQMFWSLTYAPDVYLDLLDWILLNYSIISVTAYP